MSLFGKLFGTATPTEETSKTELVDETDLDATRETLLKHIHTSLANPSIKGYLDVENAYKKYRGSCLQISYMSNDSSISKAKRERLLAENRAAAFKTRSAVNILNVRLLTLAAKDNELAVEMAHIISPLLRKIATEVGSAQKETTAFYL